MRVIHCTWNVHGLHLTELNTRLSILTQADSSQLDLGHLNIYPLFHLLHKNYPSTPLDPVVCTRISGSFLPRSGDVTNRDIISRIRSILRSYASIASPAKPQPSGSYSCCASQHLSREKFKGGPKRVRTGFLSREVHCMDESESCSSPWSGLCLKTEPPGFDTIT